MNKHLRKHPIKRKTDRPLWPRFLSALLAILWMGPIPSAAQVTVSSLTEMQRGRVPGADSAATSTLYEQFNADYIHKGLQAGLRAEVFHTWRNAPPGSPLSSVEYQTLHIPQKYLRWSHGATYLVAGNYYATLGRGLSLRAFEVPGVVLESQTFRRRYAPSRDLEGGMASWSANRTDLKALIGRPVLGDIPPGIRAGSPPEKVKQRGGWVAGSELSFRLLPSLKVGGTAVTLHADAPDSNWAWSSLLDLDLTSFFNQAGFEDLFAGMYAEYAIRKGLEKGHGLYLSANLSKSNLGLSLEYKNYDNFILNINDPPSLVREHAAVLLNRSTHVLLATAETGYQAEATYDVSSLGTFTANISKGRNEITRDFVKVFNERYIAFDLLSFAPTFSATWFVDWGKDELEGLLDHRTGGVLLEGTLFSGHTTGLDIQLQRASRPLENTPSYTDLYAQVSWQHPSGFGAALVMDRTTDPLEVDDAATLDRVETGARTLWATNLNAQFRGHYEVLLFAGKRRGGTACTSGTCYQVLPFTGVELRLSTHF